MEFGELIQTAEWKNEKHVPVIEAVQEDGKIRVKVSVGKEIPHPNTTAHHIAWIELYFLPEGEKNPYMIGRYEFTSHGASVKGADTSDIYSEPEIEAVIKTEKHDTLYAFSYCNIHGLWAGKQEI